jgi:2-polyprenyl-3-methyl-5-hydroxy-6-metoxy-1,4-benzoquinol methylase
MIWPKRSNELELIDLGPPYYTQEEYLICLDKLNKVGEYLGGERASFKTLKKLSFSPASILDVGCGGGGFTQKLGKCYKNSMVKGIEISSTAVNYAQTHHRLKNVVFEYCHLSDIPSKSYDIVISTLVCHHLKDESLIPFLKDCLRVAKRAVIINDLHRHPIAWMAFLLSAPLLFRNRLITHDGCLSVKRAFVRDDWERYLAELGVKGDVSWYWPFRWMVTLEAK